MDNPFPHLQSFTDFDTLCSKLFSLPFDRYIQAYQEHILTTRLKANIPAEPETVSMNSPFMLEPQNKPAQHGVLMVHGFMSSPYMMRSLAQVYQSQGFLVYAISLPGHGTLPGELMRTSSIHWLNAVDYGFRELSKHVQHLHICGFSTGATLCGILTQHYTNRIKSVAMLAPALGITPAARFLPMIHFLTYFLPHTSRFKWFSRLKEHHRTAYLSTPYKGVLNVKHIIDRFYSGNLNAFQSIPSFWLAIEKDAVVSLKPIMDFFTQHTGPHSEMLYYHSSSAPSLNKRITAINDTQLQANVLQLSHVAPIVPPQEPYYGEGGSLYGPSLHPKTVYGEITPGHLMNPHFKRLSFNPDYERVKTRLVEFLKKLT